MMRKELVQESFDAIEEYYHDKKGDVGITFDAAWFDDQVNIMAATNQLSDREVILLRRQVSREFGGEWV